MVQVLVRDDLHDLLTSEAKQQTANVQELVNSAIESYLLEKQRAKLDQEIVAFRTMHAELWQRYPQQWVAIHEQQVVDHDLNVADLRRRVSERFGRTAVLLRHVEAMAERELWLRAPTTSKIR